MTVTMTLSQTTTRLTDVESETGTFTAVALRDTPDSFTNEVMFFVNPETAASALAIADAFREAALRHLPAQEPAKDEVPA